MIHLYLKQAWALLKQNKLFSTLYIAGTGLAIAMTMVMADSLLRQDSSRLPGGEPLEHALPDELPNRTRTGR